MLKLLKIILKWTDNHVCNDMYLKLWNGHLKRLLANLSRRLCDLQQHRHKGRVQRPTCVGAHRHAKFPLHVHQLDRKDKTNQLHTKLVTRDSCHV